MTSKIWRSGFILICLIFGFLFIAKYNVSFDNARTQVSTWQTVTPRIVQKATGKENVFSSKNVSFDNTGTQVSWQTVTPMIVQKAMRKENVFSSKNVTRHADKVLWLTDENSIRDCKTGKILENKTTQHGSVQQFKDINFKPKTVESFDLRKQSFQKIFNTRAWGGKKKANDSISGLSASGPGSSLLATQEIRESLDHVIQQLKILTGKSKIKFLDLPCGDFQWMGKFLSTRNDVEYTGIDIVPDLINNHKKKFANQIDWKFIHTDIIVNPLEESYDLILCRMLLQHLVTIDAIKLLQRFSDSNSSFLLTTTFPHVNYYQEVKTNSQYRFRLINLEVPPFSLVRPLCLSKDDTKPRGEHFVGLWKLPLTRVKDCMVAHTVRTQVKSISKVIYTCQGK